MDTVRYEWPEGKRVGVTISLDFDGETPYLWRSRNTERARFGACLGEIEQRRFGPRQGIYRLLELFQRWDIEATVFVPGFIAENYPQAVGEIVKCGHEIGLHGYLHERVDELDADEMEKTLTRSRELIEKITGRRPMGYRSPSWEMTAAALQVVERLRVSYDSSLMGYDQPYWIGGVMEIPVQWILDDAIYYRYTGGLNAPSPRNPADVTELWRREFEGMKRWGGLFMLTMPPWISGSASRLLAVESLIELLKKDPEVWWGTCSDASRHHRETYPDAFREEAGFYEKAGLHAE